MQILLRYKDRGLHHCMHVNKSPMTVNRPTGILQMNPSDLYKSLESVIDLSSYDS